MNCVMPGGIPGNSDLFTVNAIINKQEQRKGIS